MKYTAITTLLILVIISFVPKHESRKPCNYYFGENIKTGIAIVYNCINGAKERTSKGMRVVNLLDSNIVLAKFDFLYGEKLDSFFIKKDNGNEQVYIVPDYQTVLDSTRKFIYRDNANLSFYKFDERNHILDTCSYMIEYFYLFDPKDPKIYFKFSTFQAKVSDYLHKISPPIIKRK